MALKSYPQHHVISPSALCLPLQCYQVTGGEDDEEEDSWENGDDEDEEDEDGYEYFVLQENTGYMAPTLTFLAIIHTVISLLCVLGYYYLKVRRECSSVSFKRAQCYPTELADRS